MWWAARGATLTTRGRTKFVKARTATIVDIADANAFFTELAAKVAALEELDRPHPLSVATAVAELKLYLPDPTKRIRVRDSSSARPIACMTR